MIIDDALITHSGQVHDANVVSKGTERDPGDLGERNTALEGVVVVVKEQ